MASHTERRHYTIGLVCAITVEVVAVRCMLDEEHARPQGGYRAGDYGVYTCGRIARHNVVIAYLPSGGFGAVSIARVITNMLLNFPALRVGLLVGIGGGVPSMGRDIRLGDIAVSYPQGTSNGVIQFDFGKMTHSGFRRTGLMNAPPSVLLNAMAHLRADHELKGFNMEQRLRSVMDQHPNLHPKYSFPGREYDQLFQASYIHESGSDCKRCDPAHSVPRMERSTNEPLVHYGTIASGNQVIRDGITRDRLGHEHDVICFEMEAAGLLNDFPCLVIRGIADYADSHKNKLWQGYASMAAAAYTKELLAFVPNNSIHDSSTAVDILDLNPSTIEAPASASDLSDTVSLGSTAVEALEPALVDATLDQLAQVLARNGKLKPLCSTALLRMSKPIFQRHFITTLLSLSRTIKKFIGTPLAQMIAWMLKHYKSDVALRVSEELGPEEEITDNSKLRLDLVPSAQREQLKRFISERFPVTDQRSSIAQPLTAEKDDDELPLEDDQDEDDQDPPDPELLKDLVQVEQILYDGLASKDVFEPLKSALFPSPSQLIKKVLLRHMSDYNKPTSIICAINWHVLEYLKYEGITAEDVESIFTINGEINRCYAARLGDYISETWETGKESLAFIKALLNDVSSERKFIFCKFIC